MTTTYCTRQDIEAIISAPGLLACIDDDESRDESATESTYVTKAIERAAVRLNSQVSRQYQLSDVTANGWMKWANAVMAAAILKRRRDNPLSESLAADVREVEEMANEIAWGRRSLPEQTPSFDHSATVSNFQPRLGVPYAPIRVDQNESTGPSPVGDRKRNLSSPKYPY